MFLKNTYSYFGANLDHDPAQGIFKRNFYNNCGIEHYLNNFALAEVCGFQLLVAKSLLICSVYKY